MKLKWIALIIVVIAGFFYYQKQTAWREIVSPEGRFSVWMPGKPTESLQKQSTPIGDMDLHNFILEQSNRAYAVSYSDLPTQMVTSESADDLLDGGRDGALKKANGKLLVETSISQGGNPGRELKIEGQSGTIIMRVRFYLVSKSRLYQIAIAAPKDTPIEKEASRFFDSFKLK